MIGPVDDYYSRDEVSNSDLTALKILLRPQFQQANKEAIFRFGSLVDAMITEPYRVDFFRHTVDGIPYEEDEFLHANEMRKALVIESSKDRFLAAVLRDADTQRVMINKAQQFTYGNFPFELDVRCKWDWYFGLVGFGGDLKTTFATTQSQFEEAIDYFDWDRSRAWYMDIAGSQRDFIYAISKRNFCVFKKFINRGDAVYRSGKYKYEELAFKWWCLNL